MGVKKFATVILLLAGLVSGCDANYGDVDVKITHNESISTATATVSKQKIYDSFYETGSNASDFSDAFSQSICELPTSSIASALDIPQLAIKTKSSKDSCIYSLRLKYQIPAKSTYKGGVNLTIASDDYTINGKPIWEGKISPEGSIPTFDFKPVRNDSGDDTLSKSEPITVKGEAVSTSVGLIVGLVGIAIAMISIIAGLSIALVKKNNRAFQRGKEFDKSNEGAKSDWSRNSIPRRSKRGR